MFLPNSFSYWAVEVYRGFTDLYWIRFFCLMEIDTRGSKSKPCCVVGIGWVLTFL